MINNEMSIYKLVKKNPELPEHWKEGMLVKRSDPGKVAGDTSEYGAEVANFFYYPINAKYAHSTILLSAYTVENNPENWEKQ